jgi:hypothetical protein
MKMQPLFDERSKLLTTPIDDETREEGTPALPGFWLKVLDNSEDFGELIEEWDEPILKYLSDIKFADIDPEDSLKGFFIEYVYLSIFHRLDRL